MEMGGGGDSGVNLQGSDLLSSPTLPDKCQACDITRIYSHGIYYYKEQSYDSQQVPAVQAFSRAVIDKELSPLFL